MAEVQTFRAATMQEALDIVRKELGSDAVVLETRQFQKQRFLPWLRPIQQVEITASLEVDFQALSHGEKSRDKNSHEKKTPAKKPVTSQPDVVFERSAESFNAQSLNGEQQESSLRSLLDTLSKSKPPPKKKATTTPNRTTKETARTTDSAGELGRAALPTKPSPIKPSPMKPLPVESFIGPDAEVAQKLDSIQKMLQEFGKQSQLGNAHEIPNELFHVYTDLIDAEVEDDLARSLTTRVKQNCSPEQLNDPAAVQTLLAGMVESEIRCCGPISVTPGRRKVVALVGATGVGKTTTVAKLAANFRLRDNIKMGLVTVDTYRIAAVEQLRTYADIIDLPMKVVTSSLEMRRALDELVGLDLVLIDTAGRSPRDELQIQELKSLLSEADVDEVHLVLNMTSSIRTLEATAKKFAEANATSLIMTKLDEAAGMGTLLSVAQKIPLPISYLTTGQAVPDDIEPADASYMTQLILGREKLTN